MVLKLPNDAGTPSNASTIGRSTSIEEDSGVSLATDPSLNLSIDNTISENVEIGTDKAKNIFTSLIDSATGEGANIEFPDLPETTSIDDISFWEEFTNPVNLKLMFVRDDWGKAEVIKNSFEGDSRFGGIKYDKFKNPMVEWNDKYYYVNKPGISTQDFGTVGGDVLKYLPVSKMVNSAKDIPTKLGIGLTGYTGTDAGAQALESQLAPESQKGKKLSDRVEEATKMGGISTAIDLALPPVAKAVSGTVKAGVRGGASILKKEIPSWAQPAIKSKSKYPLTQGQAQSNAPLPKTKVSMSNRLSEEDMLRNANLSDTSSIKAKTIITNFDDVQLAQIRDDAAKIQNEMGSGNIIRGQVNDLGSDVAITSAQDIKTIVTNEASQLKQIAKEGYDLIKNAPNQPIITAIGVKKMVNDAKSIIQEEGVTLVELNRMPILKQTLNDLINLSKKNVSQPFKEIMGQQKVINRAMRTAPPGSPEALLIGKIKGKVDEFVFSGIQQGLIKGNKQIIDTLKNSTDTYRQYIGITGKGSGRDKAERAVNSILSDLTNPGFEADKVVSMFFGHSNFNPSPVMATVLQRLQKNIPTEKTKEIIGLVKDAVLEKAFSGAGKSGVTRSNIVNNYNQVFNKNRNLINMLFNKEEIKKIQQFRQDVAPTLWADASFVANQSKTSYAIMSAMGRAGILKNLQIPLIAESVQGIQKTNAALDAVKQYITRSRQPLFDFPLPEFGKMLRGDLSLSFKGADSDVQALATGAKDVIMGTEEVDTTAIKNLADGLSSEARAKLIEIYQN